MSLEEDQERFFDKMASLMRASSAPPVDHLVFSIRGKEIQELLLKKAEEAEKAIENLKRHYAKIRKHVAQTRTSTLGQPMTVEDLEPFQNSALDEVRKTAEIYRFLASHVDEDRLFRLAVNDLSLIGLLPQPLPYIGPTPSSHLHSVPSSPIA